MELVAFATTVWMSVQLETNSSVNGSSTLLIESSYMGHQQKLQCFSREDLEEKCVRLWFAFVCSVQEEQLEAVLSAAVQTGSLDLLTGCIKHWTSEGNAPSIVSMLCLFWLEIVASCLFCCLFLKSSQVLL